MLSLARLYYLHPWSHGGRLSVSETFYSLKENKCCHNFSYFPNKHTCNCFMLLTICNLASCRMEEILLSQLHSTCWGCLPTNLLFRMTACLESWHNSYHQWSQRALKTKNMMVPFIFHFVWLCGNRSFPVKTRFFPGSCIFYFLIYYWFSLIVISWMLRLEICYKIIVLT